MSDAHATAMPRQTRAAQLLLFALAFGGLLVLLATTRDLTYYELGTLAGPWLFVWLCALLALTYDGGARGGVRRTTLVVLVFVLVGSLSRLLGSSTLAEVLGAALRIVLGLPVIVLLHLPQSTGWFERER